MLCVYSVQCTVYVLLVEFSPRAFEQFRWEGPRIKVFTQFVKFFKLRTHMYSTNNKEM